MPVRFLIWIVPFDLLRIKIEPELMYLTYKWYVEMWQSQGLLHRRKCLSVGVPWAGFEPAMQTKTTAVGINCMFLFYFLKLFCFAKFSLI